MSELRNVWPAKGRLALVLTGLNQKYEIIQAGNGGLEQTSAGQPFQFSRLAWHLVEQGWLF